MGTGCCFHQMMQVAFTAAAVWLAVDAPAAPPFHVEQIAPGVHAAGFDHQQQSANSGWIVLADRTVLVDLPRGVPPETYLNAIRQSGAPAPFTLVLTRWQPGDETRLAALIAAAEVDRVLCTTAVHQLAAKSEAGLPADRLVAIDSNTTIGGGPETIEVITLDGILAKGGAVVYFPKRRVLFTGPFVSNGPRTVLAGARSGPWIAALRQLETRSLDHVIPGEGSWGDAGILQRQLRFLVEVRRQVGHLVAQGRPREYLADIKLPADLLAWLPYDQPRVEDLEHVYDDLRVPRAPFDGRPPEPSDPRPHALVLIGDQPHEPGRIEQGLRPVFEATGVVPHFTVDVAALNTETLARVSLLVMFRDGHHHVKPKPASGEPWMTPQQEHAVVAFVEKGGGFLNLHNSLGLYAANGPYLNLVGGRYAGHGPLERFHVEVVDTDHPVTRGVSGFTVADEQHTPPFDEERCKLLLRSRSLNGQVTAAAGWVREVENGRVCYLANGHTREALQHPMFQRLLRNAVTWLLPRE